MAVVQAFFLLILFIFPLHRGHRQRLSSRPPPPPAPLSSAGGPGVLQTLRTRLHSEASKRRVVEEEEGMKEEEEEEEEEGEIKERQREIGTEEEFVCSFDRTYTF